MENVKSSFFYRKFIEIIFVKFSNFRKKNTKLLVTFSSLPEEFSLLLPGAEPELDLRGEPVRLEAQRVLDVTLAVEGGGHCLQLAVRPRPARITLALRGP